MCQCFVLEVIGGLYGGKLSKQTTSNKTRGIERIGVYKMTIKQRRGLYIVQSFNEIAQYTPQLVE